MTEAWSFQDLLNGVPDPSQARVDDYVQPSHDGGVLPDAPEQTGTLQNEPTNSAQNDLFASGFHGGESAAPDDAENDDRIDYEDFAADDMDCGLFQELLSSKEDLEFCEDLVLDIRMLRYYRERYVSYTDSVSQVIRRCASAYFQLKLQLEIDRGGILITSVQNLPAARDEKLSWRGLPAKYIGPQTTPRQWHVFLTKFTDAAAVDVAVMANTITSQLEKSFISESERDLSYPKDGLPTTSSEVFEYITNIRDDEGIDALEREQTNIHGLTLSMLNALNDILRDLSLFNQKTARLRQRLRDAISICVHTDAEFEGRPEATRSVIFSFLARRAVLDNEPIDANTHHRTRLWAPLAYTPLKTFLVMMLDSLCLITKVRNSIARLLQFSKRIPEFEGQEAVRRVEEREASASAREAPLFDEKLEPADIPRYDNLFMQHGANDGQRMEENEATGEHRDRAEQDLQETRAVWASRDEEARQEAPTPEDLLQVKMKIARLEEHLAQLYKDAALEKIGGEQWERDFLSIFEERTKAHDTMNKILGHSSAASAEVLKIVEKSAAINKELGQHDLA